MQRKAADAAARWHVHQRWKGPGETLCSPQTLPPLPRQRAICQSRQPLGNLEEGTVIADRDMPMRGAPAIAEGFARE